MTALVGYERLESGGIWKASPDAQRIDVAVSFGDATLVFKDQAGRPLTHWSLPAIERLNPGQRPAQFSPDGTAAETLEIDDDVLIEAIEKVRKTLRKRQANPGRLRTVIALGLLVAMGAVIFLLLPDVIRRQTLAVVTPTARAEIDAKLLAEFERLTGPSCRGTQARAAIGELSAKVNLDAPINVLPGELARPIALPGGTVLLDKAMVEIPEDPAATAGYVLLARAIAKDNDPLTELLDNASLSDAMHLLTRGTLPPEAVQKEANRLLTNQRRLPVASLTQLFATAEIPPEAWAQDYDPTGQTKLTVPNRPDTTVLNDQSWLGLQSICSA